MDGSDGLVTLVSVFATPPQQERPERSVQASGGAPGHGHGLVFGPTLRIPP
jgi:hypothetical protein